MGLAFLISSIVLACAAIGVAIACSVAVVQHVYHLHRSGLLTSRNGYRHLHVH